MSGLIKNIVGEIDNSREQMFRILESIAALEMSKDHKKFNKEKNKLSKKNIEELDKKGKEVNATKVEKKRGPSSKHSSNNLDDEEEKNSSSSSYSHRRETSSIADETEFEFGLDEEEEIF